jgi:hypothetical protein
MRLIKQRLHSLDNLRAIAAIGENKIKFLA